MLSRSSPHPTTHNRMDMRKSVSALSRTSWPSRRHTATSTQTSFRKPYLSSETLLAKRSAASPPPRLSSDDRYAQASRSPTPPSRPWIAIPTATLHKHTPKFRPRLRATMTTDRDPYLPWRSDSPSSSRTQYPTSGLHMVESSVSASFATITWRRPVVASNGETGDSSAPTMCPRRRRPRQRPRP